jgi:hypothetical protein
MNKELGLPEEVLINLARTENLNDDERAQLLSLLSKGLSEKDAKEYLSIISGKRLPSLSSDVIAKRIFDPDEHPDRLTYLLRAVTGEKSIKVAGSTKSEGYIGFIDSKKLIYDIPAELEDGRRSDTEFQIKAQDFIFPRTDLYASDLLMIQYSAEKGHKSDVTYDNVQGVIIIVLMSESPKMFRQYDKKSARYIHRFISETAESGISYDPLAKKVYVQLDKAFRQFKNGTDGEENMRLQILLSAMKDINNPAVQKKMKNDRMFSGILNEVSTLSQDKEVQIMLLAEKYAMSDIATMRKQDHAKGRAEGENRINSLYMHLKATGKTDELMRAIEDADYRESLMKTLRL